MARGRNLVILLGNLGADPETSYTQNDTAVTTVRLATSEQWKDKNTGQMQERTEWHRVKFFGRLAEVAGEYLRKGSQIYVEGSIRTDKFTGDDGQEKYFTSIIGNEMQMLGGGNGNGNSASQGGGQHRSQGGNNRQPAQGNRGQQQNRNQNQRQRQPEPAMAGNGMDDGFDDGFDANERVPF